MPMAEPEAPQERSLLREFLESPASLLNNAANFMLASSYACASIYDQYLPPRVSLLSLRFRRHQSHRDGSHKARWRARAES